MTEINKSIQRINLFVDTFSARSSVRVCVKQYDAKSRYILATIKDHFGRVTVGGVAQLNAKKPDGTFCYSRCEINDDGTVLAELPTQLLAVPGDVQCDISFFATDGSEQSILTTQTFFLTVQKSNYDSDAIESSNEYSVVTENLMKAEKNCKLAIEAAEKVEQSIELVAKAKQETLSAAKSAAESATIATEMAEKTEESAKAVNAIISDVNTAKNAAENAVETANKAVGIANAAKGLGIAKATPGQVAKITAVDDNGAPTEWTTIDLQGSIIYSIILPSSAGDWTSDDNGFIIDIAVTGMLDSDTPIIDLAIDTDKDIDEQEKSWASVYKATAETDKIRVYAKAVPSIDLTMKAMVMR